MSLLELTTCIAADAAARAQRRAQAQALEAQAAEQAEPREATPQEP